MHSVDLEVLRAAVGWLEQGNQVTLATVVETWGSAPRQVGAMLALTADGRLVGSVSGGCIEDDLLLKIKNGQGPQERPEVVTYGVSAEEARRFGLPCGGTLRLVLESLSSAASWKQVLEAIERREVVARKLDIQSGEARVAPATTNDETAFDEQTLITVHGPRWRLVIVGAGQMTVYLAQMAQALDYHVLVCDPREEYRASWGMPGVELSTMMPDDYLVSLKLDRHTAIVALTHDPKQDDLALLEALKSDAFYVGAIGSRKHQESRRERLAEFGITQQELTRLHGPIGLPLGGKTPPEMAIAILADMTASRYGVELQVAPKPKPAPKLSAVG
jgi:xanthine dehydrogenase accessory factor